LLPQAGILTNCLCIYIQIFIYVYIYTQTRTYTNTHTYIYIHTHNIYIYIYIYMLCIRLCVCTYICITLLPQAGILTNFIARIMRPYKNVTFLCLCRQSRVWYTACCSVLQCVAVCCSVLQCVATKSTLSCACVDKS